MRGDLRQRSRRRVEDFAVEHFDDQPRMEERLNEMADQSGGNAEGGRGGNRHDGALPGADVLRAGACLDGPVTMTTFVSFEAREMRRERYRLLDDLDVARRDGACWREASRAHVQGLSRAIASQFAAWGLTEAEADVAGLILKGLSHKEIATLRLGSEATVRQHATAVYRKSGLPGRAQLTAFFLEDLLMPVDPEGSNGGRVVALKAGR